MPVSRTITLRDNDHFVTYVNAGGATVTAPRDLVLTVFAPDRPGTWPVIVYSHGHGGSSSPNGGTGLTAQALADLGYIVIVPNHLDSGANYPAWLTSQFSPNNDASGLHRAADIQFALDQAATLTAGFPGYTADLTAPAVAGHSHGAFTAGLIAGLRPDRPGYDAPPGNPYGLTSVADPRFRAAILLSPQGEDSSWADLTPTSWDRIAIPLLTITGTEDEEPGGFVDWHGRLDPFRNGDGRGNYAVVYRDASHGDIGGNTSIPGITASITRLIDRFLDGELQGDAAARAMLGDPAGLLASEPLLSQAFARADPGTPGIGALTGTTGGDTLDGLTSDDWITGGAGADILSGGSGNDTILGGDGNDQIRGGPGNDFIDGGHGDDVFLVQGTPGNYRLLVSGNSFILKGLDGVDFLTGIETIRFSDGRIIELNRLYAPEGEPAESWPSVDDHPDVALAGLEDTGCRLSLDWVFS
ncbi:hypothetical protein [Brevundimonas sp.]|uniref:hypothetical protein n=1 Tax=Brevundimonas sp. TaxID=1871086 RepID=UPI002626DD07|nr:hypothetical protein [Brevundimonas sp.]